MLMRWTALSVLLLAGVASSSRDKEKVKFDCEFEGDLHHHFDVHKLAGEKLVTVKRSTPPSTITDELRFNLCGELSHQVNLADTDQCSRGTRACLIQKNDKPDQITRITAAIPLFDDEDLLPDYHELAHDDGVSILFHGPLYPPTPMKNQRQIRQYFNLTLFCEPDGSSDPQLIHYDSVTGEAHIEWYTEAGCAKEWDSHDRKKRPHDEDHHNAPAREADAHRADAHRADSHRADSHHDDHHDDHHDLYDDEDDHGAHHWNDHDYPHDIPENGHGGFFFMCFLIVAVYLGVGAWYNHKNYGARGWDLVPHKAFWREVPVMTKGFAYYAYSKARPRSDGHSKSESFHEV